MALNYRNLDNATRDLMLAEIEADVASGTLYFSNYLSESGKGEWLDLLGHAAQQHDDSWLAEQLQLAERLKTEVRRKKPKGGGFTIVQVPSTAPSTLSEGEFNRYYVRALCRRSIDSSGRVTVYRARASENPRPESEALVGKEISAAALLEDLRANTGVEAALGLAKPNSGLSVML